MKKILVVVDMQNDFIDGPLGTPEARAIVDNVCAKIREGEWDWIISTMDTHFDDKYLDSQEGQKLPVKHCIYNTDGWNPNKNIRISIEEEVAKHADNVRYYGYSLAPKGTFGSMDLAHMVNSFLTTIFVWPKDVELTLVGVCTDICVVSNALLLKAHFPEMKIVVDASCCAGSTPEKHYMALEVMKSCQIDVVNNDMDIIRENAVKMVSAAYGIPADLLIKNYGENEE